MTLEFSGLNVTYTHGRQKEVIRDYGMSLAPGEIATIVGISGGGKSTIALALAGLLSSNVAQVSIRNFTFFEESRLSFLQREKIGFVFQKPVFFDWWSIEENISKYLVAAEVNRSKTEIEQIADQLLIRRALGLRPSEVSGGMLARAALVRAISIHPRLLILDEAFSGIDEVQKGAVLSAIAKYTKENNAITIAIAHNLVEAAMLSDKVLILSAPPIDDATVLSSNLRRSDDTMLAVREDASLFATEIRQYLNSTWRRDT